jgi:flagellar biosynthesis/type III secretory pathway protein FliH
MNWIVNPLLNGGAHTPRYLRTQWDEKSAREFGPWRIASSDASAQQSEPIAAPTLPVVEAPMTEAAPLPSLSADVLETAQSRLSEEALGLLREESFQRGLQAGREELRLAHETEQQRSRELLRNLGIELRSLQQDPQRLHEPLKRLSVHLAEQLVRGELQVSGQVVHRLITQCIEHIEHPSESVVVTLHPQDLERLRALGDEHVAGMKLEADAQLTLGSVRVRVNDTQVQDLMAHRLEPLVRRLLAQPDAWLQRSGLLQEAVALSDNEPSRRWKHAVVDVQDTEPKPAGNSPSHPPDTSTGGSDGV